MIGVDRQEFRLELLAGTDVDRHDLVGHAELFESDVHLVAIGGRPSPHFDHVDPHLLCGPPIGPASGAGY